MKIYNAGYIEICENIYIFAETNKKNNKFPWRRKYKAAFKIPPRHATNLFFYPKINILKMSCQKEKSNTKKESN